MRNAFQMDLIITGAHESFEENRKKYIEHTLQLTWTNYNFTFNIHTENSKKKKSYNNSKSAHKNKKKKIKTNERNRKIEKCENRTTHTAKQQQF